MATSREYWRRREAEALKHYIRDEREYDKRLAQNKRLIRPLILYLNDCFWYRMQLF